MSEAVPTTIRSLSFKTEGKRCSLEFDSEYLTCSFHTRPGLHITKTPLWRIMPEFVVDQSIPDSSRRHGRLGWYSFAAGTVFFFSDVRDHAPLLVPALFLCGGYGMFRMFRGLYPPDKTRILNEAGDEIAVIPHHERLATERKNFEDTLLEAIRRARHKHYAA